MFDLPFKTDMLIALRKTPGSAGGYLLFNGNQIRIPLIQRLHGILRLRRILRRQRREGEQEDGERGEPPAPIGGFDQRSTHTSSNMSDRRGSGNAWTACIPRRRRPASSGRRCRTRGGCCIPRRHRNRPSRRRPTAGPRAAACRPPSACSVRGLLQHRLISALTALPPLR